MCEWATFSFPHLPTFTGATWSVPKISLVATAPTAALTLHRHVQRDTWVHYRQFDLFDFESWWSSVTALPHRKSAGPWISPFYVRQWWSRAISFRCRIRHRDLVQTDRLDQIGDRQPRRWPAGPKHIARRSPLIKRFFLSASFLFWCATATYWKCWSVGRCVRDCESERNHNNNIGKRVRVVVITDCSFWLVLLLQPRLVHQICKIWSLPKFWWNRWWLTLNTRSCHKKSIVALHLFVFNEISRFSQLNLVHDLNLNAILHLGLISC